MTGCKEFIKSNLILLILMAAAFLSGLIIIGARMGVESANKSYDIVLDYQEIDAMARQSKEATSLWLERFKEMKITKVGLAEESLGSLMDGEDLPVSAEIMDVLTKEAGWRGKYPAAWIEAVDRLPFDKYDVMVDMRSKEAYDFVAKGLARYESGRVLLFPEADGGYALLDGTPEMTLYTPRYKKQNSLGGGFQELIDITDSKLIYLSLGMLPDKVALIQGLGMEIIPRTMSYDTWNDEKYARAVIADYEKYGITPHYMIVGGEGVPGYDDGIARIEQYAADNGIVFGLIENTTQLQNILQHGVLELTEASAYNTVRVFSVWDYIQYRYQYYGYEGAQEIENTLFRAVAERNIRLIYYKPIREFKDLHTYMTDLDEYKEMFTNLERRLAKHGIAYGEASVMQPYEAPLAARLILALGCAAAGVLLLHLFFPLPRRVKWILFGLGAVCAAGAFWAAPNFTGLITSLANAMIFACLATVFFTHRAKKFFDRSAGAAGPPHDGRADRIRVNLSFVFPAAIVTLIGAVAIALVGGILTAAPISSVNYMLEIDIFRGVKAAQILPIVFFAVAYLAYFGFGSKKQKSGRLEFHDIKEMMNTSVKVWMVFLALVLAAGGVYYILRTGHEVLEVSKVEMLFRNELEELLLARPRTKEFLFAFPAIMLMAYTACRRLRFWTVMFGVCGVVGVTSVINTFMHIRTPLYLGFVRTAYSVAFGLVIGIVAILVFNALLRLYGKIADYYLRKMSA
ncbi:MAG: DUF5693 family protein [Clostridiales Family XIII bacterium]|jgi:hypothetical protein|nr:DUF5693 family protein [Clostridiales Family XIII bacterium]